MQFNILGLSTEPLNRVSAIPSAFYKRVARTQLYDVHAHARATRMKGEQ
jgi:hypothetical protein